MQKVWRNVLSLTVLVASLGYFVDMFDLTIFGVVRVASLKDLGITNPAEITSQGILLVNLQALGMLIGGLLWGILSDKKGRLSVLFGSIFLYSTANILNAFITDIHQYAALRFIAGIGLAGELGAAVTLVSEMLKPEERGYGTTIIAALGLLGAVAASLIGQFFSWKTAYLVGGSMGFFLLLSRFRMVDSVLFKKLQSESSVKTSKGDLRLLFREGRLLKYVFCIFAGVPIYFITGILLTFAPELSQSLGLQGVTAGNALLAGTIGLTIGDLACGLLSQLLESRKKAILSSLLTGFAFCLIYFSISKFSTQFFYVTCFALGLSAGYWAVLITVAAEQFGTNIRGTVATSVPNFVRAAVIPMTLFFAASKSHIGVLPAAIALGLGVFSLALFSLWKLSETYATNLDFIESSSLVPQQNPINASLQSEKKMKPLMESTAKYSVLIMFSLVSFMSLKTQAQDSAGKSTTTAPKPVVTTTPSWKTTTSAYYFNMDGTHAAVLNSYTFGHVDVSLENFGGEYTINPDWKISANLQAVQNSYELIAKSHTYLEQSSGLGDSALEMIHPASVGDFKLITDFGISLPTGNINQANIYVPNAHYKYFMQLGSGTTDGIAGITSLYIKPAFTLGGRFSTVQRTGALNSNGYHLGNQFRADVWADAPIAQGLKAKLYAYDRDRGAITGNDYTLNPAATQYYYRDQIDWMAAAALTYRYQFLPELSLNAEAGVPLISGMINVDNVVISTRYYANLSLFGQF